MTALLPETTSDASLRRFLHGLPGVDEVGARQRIEGLATRSVKGDTKRRLLDLAIAMTDLTTLEGMDTPGRVRSLCAKAAHPDPEDPTTPAVAAVCVYPDLVATAKEALRGTAVKVASVATAFPAGRATLRTKLADVAEALGDGADEIDMVIDRGAFLAGRYGAVHDEIVEVKQVCGDAHLKVILETGELATPDNARKAAWLAMLAGADFVKTSTGKVTPAATPVSVLVLLQAVRDAEVVLGRRVGVKAAGGIRTAKEAVRYLVLVAETAGEDWLTPHLFRFGASTLLNDLLLQRTKQRTGAYAPRTHLTID